MTTDQPENGGPAHPKMCSIDSDQVIVMSGERRKVSAEANRVRRAGADNRDTFDRILITTRQGLEGKGRTSRNLGKIRVTALNRSRRARRRAKWNARKEWRDPPPHMSVDLGALALLYRPSGRVVWKLTSDLSSFLYVAYQAGLRDTLVAVKTACSLVKVKQSQSYWLFVPRTNGGCGLLDNMIMSDGWRWEVVKRFCGLQAVSAYHFCVAGLARHGLSQHFGAARRPDVRAHLTFVAIAANTERRQREDFFQEVEDIASALGEELGVSQFLGRCHVFIGDLYSDEAVMAEQYGSVVNIRPLLEPFFYKDLRKATTKESRWRPTIGYGIELLKQLGDERMRAAYMTFRAKSGELRVGNPKVVSSYWMFAPREQKEVGWLVKEGWLPVIRHVWGGVALPSFSSTERHLSNVPNAPIPRDDPSWLARLDSGLGLQDINEAVWDVEEDAVEWTENLGRSLASRLWDTSSPTGNESGSLSEEEEATAEEVWWYGDNPASDDE